MSGDVGVIHINRTLSGSSAYINFRWIPARECAQVMFLHGRDDMCRVLGIFWHALDSCWM